MPGRQVQEAQGAPQDYTGHELDETTGFHYAGARYDSSALARWGSVDPLADEFPAFSPYTYVENNPLALTDPTGMAPRPPGDYYDENGDFLGNDGIDDGKVYVAKKGKGGAVKSALENGYADAAKSRSVELPDRKVRTDMVQAHEEAQPFREEGGVIISTDDGQELVRAKPGPETDPSKESHASINVYDSKNPSDLNDATGELGKFHTHPTGTVTKGNTTHGFDPQPSNIDLRNASGARLNDYVLSNKVHIYDRSGVITTFPISRFDDKLNR